MSARTVLSVRSKACHECPRATLHGYIIVCVLEVCPPRCLCSPLACWFLHSTFRLVTTLSGYRACQGEDGKDDLKKGTQLLEVYALEIQMHTELKNTKRLKELYSRALTIKSAIPHPRIMGIIRECGGKMHMHERVWSEAATDFFEVHTKKATPVVLCTQCGFRIVVGAEVAPTPSLMQWQCCHNSRKPPC